MILYSPPAVAHIPDGADYLRDHFWQPADVARHVNAGQLTALATGSPGSFRLRFTFGSPDESAVRAARFKLRLALQVREQTVCVRDLYDLLDWVSECPLAQQFPAADGWYRLTVFSSPPNSGILEDGQVIDVVMEPVDCPPAVHWDGVPTLGDP